MTKRVAGWGLVTPLPICPHNELYAQYYNKHRIDKMYNEGDLVLVNGKNISVDKQTKKLH